MQHPRCEGKTFLEELVSSLFVPSSCLNNTYHLICHFLSAEHWVDIFIGLYVMSLSFSFWVAISNFRPRCCAWLGLFFSLSTWIAFAIYHSANKHYEILLLFSPVSFNFYYSLQTLHHQEMLSFPNSLLSQIIYEHTEKEPSTNIYSSILVHSLSVVKSFSLVCFNQSLVHECGFLL